ncbi:ATP-binding protein [Streptomyces panacea]|uniref:ATP-binding protein n=1 Tax=Streptomyces panacea TaxID=3035064 RepID=UPI003F49DF34
MLPEVFGRFVRADHARSCTTGSSTGPGLAIVHAVVTAHGGTVDVGSRPGRTVFTVTLPASPPARARPPREPDATDRRRLLARCGPGSGCPGGAPAAWLKHDVRSLRGDDARLGRRETRPHRHRPPDPGPAPTRPGPR